MLFPCGILLCFSALGRKTLVTMATLLLVRDSVGSLQIWGMFLFGPSPHVIDFDDVSSQYEGKYIVL